jgi:hypothetical protein
MIKTTLQAPTRYFVFSNGNGFSKYVPDLGDPFVGVEWVRGKYEKEWTRAGIQSEAWFEKYLAQEQIWEFTIEGLLNH